MATVIIHNRVSDYDRWFGVFSEMESYRRGYGATHHHVFRSASDPNEIVIVVEYSSVADAQAAVQDPQLRAAMERAGIVGPPQIWVTEEADSRTY